MLVFASEVNGTLRALIGSSDAGYPVLVFASEVNSTLRAP